MTTFSQEPLNAEQVRLTEAGPVLLASRCPRCERHYFPRRWVCAVDQTDVVDVELSREGVLRVATYVSTPSYGKSVLDAEGYGVGEVDLPEGVRVQSVLGGARESWKPGHRMRIEPYVVLTRDDGCELVGFRFSPADGDGS